MSNEYGIKRKKEQEQWLQLKKAIFIGLYLEKCCLVEQDKNLVEGKSTGGRADFHKLVNEKILVGGGALPRPLSHPPIRENADYYLDISKKIRYLENEALFFL